MKFSNVAIFALAGLGLAKPTHRSGNEAEQFLNIVEDIAKLNSHSYFARDIVRYMTFDKQNAKPAMERLVEEFKKLDGIAKQGAEDTQNIDNRFDNKRAQAVIHRLGDWTHTTTSLLNYIQDEAKFMKQNVPEQVQELHPQLENYNRQLDEMLSNMEKVVDNDKDGEWIKRRRQRLDKEMKETVEKLRRGGQGGGGGDDDDEPMFRRIY